MIDYKDILYFDAGVKRPSLSIFERWAVDAWLSTFNPSSWRCDAQLFSACPSILLLSSVAKYNNEVHHGAGSLAILAHVLVFCGTIIGLFFNSVKNWVSVRDMNGMMMKMRRWRCYWNDGGDAAMKLKWWWLWLRNEPRPGRNVLSSWFNVLAVLIHWIASINYYVNPINTDWTDLCGVRRFYTWLSSSPPSLLWHSSSSVAGWPGVTLSIGQVLLTMQCTCGAVNCDVKWRQMTSNAESSSIQSVGQGFEWEVERLPPSAHIICELDRMEVSERRKEYQAYHVPRVATDWIQ